MFDESGSQGFPSPRTKSSSRRVLPFALGGAIALLIVIATFLGYKILSLPGFVIPEHIISNTSHTIFVPQKLPTGYSIVDGSFGISEEGGLFFRAEDPSGSSIAFTEQKTPKDFDFEGFYQKDMQNAKKLAGIKHQSVIGKLPSGEKTLLSVVIEDTWILVSTAAPLGEQDFVTIAKGIKQY